MEDPTEPRGTEAVLKRLRLAIHGEDGSARLDRPLVERLLLELAGDDEAGYVTLEGEGEVFCDGMDIAALSARDQDPTEAIHRFADLLHAIETAPRPVVALVRGRALGGGLGLAAACDVVIAHSKSRFGLPEAIFGLVPAMVLPVIARRTGHARVRRLALTGLTLSAHEAREIGLIDEINDDLEGALEAYARRFGYLDSLALACVKSLADASVASPDGYRIEAVTRLAELLARPETRIRVERFMAGATPWPDGDLR